MRGEQGGSEKAGQRPLETEARREWICRVLKMIWVIFAGQFLLFEVALAIDNTNLANGTMVQTRWGGRPCCYIRGEVHRSAQS